MASIRALSFRLVRRLATPCPCCGSPGWGRIGTEAGLPCGWCGQPTALERVELLGCPSCEHRAERPRRDGLQSADPGQCGFCNPQAFAGARLQHAAAEAITPTQATSHRSPW